MKKAKLSLWNNRYSEVFDFTPSETGKPNYTVKTQQDPENDYEFVDLHSFEKIIKKFESKNEKKIENLNDLDAIFGDASFYKDTEEREDIDAEIEPNEVSEFNMDNFHKIPITYGKQSGNSSGKPFSTLSAVFWYKSFDDMMSEKAIEQALYFYDSIKEFFENQIEHQNDTWC